MTATVQCICESACRLGEGPLWDSENGRLLWVDIKAPALFAMHLGSRSLQRWPMPEPIGAIGLRAKGGLVGALRSGFALIDLDTGAATPIGSVSAHPSSNRFNDGHVDPHGRFWAGTMDDSERTASGHLYRLDADHRVELFTADFAVTNGIEWSGDGRTLYFVESAQRRIWAYDFDMKSGRPGRRRLFVELTPDAGYPDGLTVDAEDHVWSAHWDGGRVTRYRPDGTVERVVPLPVPRTTSCCFGGPNLGTLFVTSARIGLDDAALGAAPLSGAVFAVTGLGVRGRLPHKFLG